MVADQSLSREAFTRIAGILRTRVGIELAETKQSLMLARLGSLMRSLGMSSYAQLADVLEADPSGPLVLELVNRLSTNHTFFNREERHFSFLREDLIPYWKRQLDQGQRGRVRVWSAGCSSGEEPYNIAMTLADQPTVGGAARILATDIAPGAIEKAESGVYSKAALDKLSPEWRKRYINSHLDGGIVAPAITRMIVFRRLNLIRPDFPFRHQFDLVFVRNVMIYFRDQLRKEVVGNILRYVTDGGYLIVGHSETLERSAFPIDYVQPGIYRKHPLGGDLTG